MPNDWIPATKWVKLEGMEDAERRREAHRAKPWFAKDFLLEICHNAGTWYARYCVKKVDFRIPIPELV